MVYTVTCNPALDYVMQVPHLQTRDINRSECETLTFGGKGINVSAVLARLSVPTRALGFTAGFMGEKLKSLLIAEGIACDFVELSVGETRINVKIRTDTEIDINAGGPPVGDKDVDRLLQKLDALCPGDVLVLAGSVLSGLPQDLYVQMLKRLNGREVLVVVDAEKDLLRETLPYRPFLIKPNHHELGALFGKELHTAEEIVQCARQLQAEGARNVLVSRAQDGALLLDENGTYRVIGNAPGTLRNSVGCGDSMVAGFIAGWLQENDYAHALRLGTACGNATAYSDTLATKAEIDAALSYLESKQYDDEVKRRFGDTAAYKESQIKTAEHSKEKWNAVGDEMNAIFAAFAACMNNGERADDDTAQALVKKLQDYITGNFYHCTDEILAGLGQMYVDDERFKNNIDKHSTGTAQFVLAAINIYCKK